MNDAKIAPTAAAVSRPKSRPSHVLPGLSQKMSLCLPSERPPK
jgi:hypothetical protein